MTRPINILAFAGSTRRESLNKKLAVLAAETAEVAGAQSGEPVHVTWVDLKHFPIPLYDGDYEEQFGLPPAALKLRDLVRTHDALLIASPEYNGFPSPLLKNTLDWLSRPYGGEERHAVFKDKPVLLLAATRGEAGGRRGLAQLRQLLGNLKAASFEQEYVLPKGNEALDALGRLRDPEAQSRLANVVGSFVAYVRERQSIAA